MSESEIALPPLQIADIDRDTLRELFVDVETLAHNLEIVLKRGSEQHVVNEPSRSLSDAMSELLLGTAVGAQLRYRFKGADWWDTLLRTENGFRLVRIQHRPES